MKPVFRITSVIIFLLIYCSSLPAADPIRINLIDPPMWWTGMKNPELMLTIQGNGIANLNPVIIYPGVTIKTVTRSGNANYLFINLFIGGDAKPGTMKIDFTRDKKIILSCNYELRDRQSQPAERKSFGPEDVIYLLMPDRFANGIASNDSLTGLKEKCNRTDPDGRHGGDIQGIIDHLDYLKDLGITAIWTTPLLEDNMPAYSYHTYAITDYYKVDGRYGTNQDYVRLAEECHKRGIKLIMDMVPNHCGSEHWWMKDLPMEDWVHSFPKFTRTNYTIATWNDPHASSIDKMLNEEGWFDVSMPDMNQGNPFVQTYLKQFAIFWVEYLSLDGLRVDTYPYNEKYKIAEWSRSIREEYPWLNIVGECWQHNPAENAYWQSGTKTYDGYDSQLPAVMDFPLLDAFGTAFNENGNDGLSRFYNIYVLDYLFADPYNMLIFLDNHDSQRFTEQIGYDLNKYKMGVAHLLTTRGIPEIYYGTEIMMGGQKSKGDGDIRRDFPGGWPGDTRNAFIPSGRTPGENEAFAYIRKLLHYRAANPVLQKGKMIQFIPRDNMYVYFRKDEKKTVMVMMNNSGEKLTPDVGRFEECLSGRRTGKDIITGSDIDLTKFSIEPKSVMILEII
jgi:neopullulanase